MWLVLVFFLLVFPASALGISPDVFIRASSASGVPVELLLAVSHVESRFNPHALNVAGRPFFPSSLSEAERILRPSGDNVDIGLMQVNWGVWGRRLGYSKLELLDPALNVLVGARILARYVRLRGDWWQGVGSYHSPRAERQWDYIQKVWDSYSRVLSGVRR